MEWLVALVALVVAALAVLAILVVWRGSLAVRLLGARLALLRAARAHLDVTVESSFPRVLLSIARGAGKVEIMPCTLGFLREHPTHKWWWVTARADAPTRATLHVCLRRPQDPHPIISSQHLLASGDEAFDARHVSYVYSPSDKELADVMTLLHDVEVQRLAQEILVESTDSCTLGSRIFVSRRRPGCELEDALVQLRRTVRLAEAVERAFARAPYRG